MLIENYIFHILLTIANSDVLINWNEKWNNKIGKMFYLTSNCVGIFVFLEIWNQINILHVLIKKSFFLALPDISQTKKFYERYLFLISAYFLPRIVYLLFSVTELLPDFSHSNWNVWNAKVGGWWRQLAPLATAATTTTAGAGQQ